MSKKPVIGVLLGGLSSERDISLASGKACVEALQRLDYPICEMDVGEDIAEQLLAKKPDIALNALHGGAGENGIIQGLLESLHIPYTHSGVCASALAMDKVLARAQFSAAGIAIAPGIATNTEQAASQHILPPPYVIKPLSHGSSVGVHIVEEGDAVPSFLVAKDWKYGERILLESYIAGMELSCGIMGEKVLPIVEIKTPKDKLYDYEAKYTPQGSRHELPAKLPKQIYAQVQEATRRAYHALGCRGVARADFRYDRENNMLVILEVNTQPGMTKTSLIMDMAEYDHISHDELVHWMVEDASCQR
ncbi:MAG: D-alanine--D-alanine ligase [Parvibaculales bacterium]